jgi:hypothetical protein
MRKLIMAAVLLAGCGQQKGAGFDEDGWSARQVTSYRMIAGRVWTLKAPDGAMFVVVAGVGVAKWKDAPEVER